MDEDDVLTKLHSLQLILADELKRICDKYDIKYVMIGGTLLGAIRHKGFIPWDDDMDFAILRKDYERFISVCDKELDSHIFYLQTEKKEKYYPFLYAKLSLIGTAFKEDYINTFNVHQGIFIDIFPIDIVPDNAWGKRFQYTVLYITNRLIRIKTGYEYKNHKKSIQNRMGHFLSKIFSIKFLKTTRHNYITKYANEKSKYVINADGGLTPEDETEPREWYENIRDYSFEGRLYSGIADYDGYLSRYYKDYMTPPPADKRKQHGNITIDFGKY